MERWVQKTSISKNISQIINFQKGNWRVFLSEKKITKMFVFHNYGTALKLLKKGKLMKSLKT